MNVEILNESYFDYTNVVFEVYFMNSNGSTINKEEQNPKDIFFAKSTQDAQVSVGLMDFKFSSIEIAIISGDSSLDKGEVNKKTVLIKK